MIAIRKTQERLEKSQAPGGSVCNTMRAMACLGANTGFIGKIGTDAVGEYYEKALLDANVSPYFIKTEGISGSCTVLISKDGERTMGTFLGPAPTITPDEIKEEILSRYQLYIYRRIFAGKRRRWFVLPCRRLKKLGLKVALDLVELQYRECIQGNAGGYHS